MPIIDTSTIMTPCRRPTLTLCVDIHSRMIASWAISWEQPSVRTALSAVERSHAFPVATEENANPARKVAECRRS
jgi:hypothetical protein